MLHLRFCLAVLSLVASNFVTAQTRNDENRQLKAHCDSLLLWSGDLLDYDLDSAKIIANQLLDFSIEKQYPRGQLQAYSQLGHIYSYQAMRGSALDNYQKALAIAKQESNQLFEAMLDESIGFLLYEDGKYEEALEYLNSSMPYFIEKNRLASLGNVKLAQALIYLKTGLAYEKVINTLHEVEEMARNEDMIYLLIETLNTQSLAYLTFEKNLNKVLTNSKEALKMIQSNDPLDYFDQGITHANLSQYYQLTNQSSIALDYTDSAIFYLDQTQSIADLTGVYQTRIDLYNQQQNYQKANEAYAKLLDLKSRLFDQQQADKINDLQTQYETEKKEAEIAHLSQQTAIQDLEINRRNQTIVIGIISFVFLLGLSYFWYFRQSTLRKRQQVEIEQRFLRSQLNPHFISNALVAIQNSLLTNDAESTSSYLSTFARLMREILENSREEYIALEDEVNMLRDYLELNRKRLEDSFSYQIDVSDDLDLELDRIPPMFVQPFVENALEYGLGNDQQQGKIDVLFSREGDYLKVVVSDNGPGLQETKSSFSQKRSLSSSIIRERINLLNHSMKKSIKLSLEDRKDHLSEIVGAQVTIYIPL